MIFRSHFIDSDVRNSLHLKEISLEDKGFPLIFVHGSLENGRIFYTDSGKGLAPYLAQKGFRCFVLDLRGKGESKPSLYEGNDFHQSDLITIDLPAIVDFVLKHTGEKNFSIVSHSWGGVLANSFLLEKNHYLSQVSKQVHISTKRRIKVINLHRLFFIELMWVFVGNLFKWTKGYLPKNLYGPEGETKGFLTDTQKWVYSKNWVDLQRNVDYNHLAQNHNLPSTLYLTGSKDMCLGHIRDVTDFALESGHHEKDVLYLSKKNGALEDYDHVNILTSKKAVDDHYPKIADFLNEGR